MNEDERKQKIYAEILAEAQKTCPQKLEGEFSLMDFANDAGINRDHARKIIKQMLDEKKFKARKTGRGTFYSVV